MMNKEPKTLPQAIKILVGIYGKDVVKDVRMVNIMNDVVSLQDPNAVRTILRDCIRLGYGGKLLVITPKDDYHLKIKSFSKDISDSYGYKDIIVQYILYSIAFGVGICPKEPYLRNTEAPKATMREIKENQYIKRDSEVEADEDNKKLYIIIAAIIVVVLVIGGIYGVNYQRSSAARDKFEETIVAGNSLLNQGDYDNAIKRYKEAYSSYNDINSDKYKYKALQKIDDVVDKYIKEGENNSERWLTASQIMESELELELSTSDKNRIMEKMVDLKFKIAEHTQNGRNTLITILSANDGKLDDAGKQLLDDLLSISPNDYWLNFIKKKSYE